MPFQLRYFVATLSSVSFHFAINFVFGSCAFSHRPPSLPCSLVISDIQGAFDKAFAHVGNLHKKAGPFQMLLAVGSFYGSSAASQAELEAYKNGSKQVPIPTYFIVPPQEENLLPKEVLLEGGVVAPSTISLARKRDLLTLFF